MSTILHAPARSAITANRGTGRRWFRVVTAHQEMIYTASGESMGPETIIEGFNLEVEAGGWFGWGEQAAIDAHVAKHYPGYEVVDTWPIAPPATEF
jgi:hypothetical protein